MFVVAKGRQTAPTANWMLLSPNWAIRHVFVEVVMRDLSGSLASAVKRASRFVLRHQERHQTPTVRRKENEVANSPYYRLSKSA